MAESKIEGLSVSHTFMPLKNPVSDAKVANGLQTELRGIDLFFVEIFDNYGDQSVGFSYTLRAGGDALFSLGCEIAPSLLGLPSADVQKHWEMLAWRVNSLGVGGLAYQTIAAFDSALWDLKAKKAGLPLAKLIGAHHSGVRVYNSGGQYLQASIDDICLAAKNSVNAGVGGIKMKVGQPNWRKDIERLEALRATIGPNVSLMIDANQQWTRSEALEFCCKVDDLGLTFIEEPLSARDYHGHAALSAKLTTPIATGEMLTSYDEHRALINAGGCSINQVDAPRIGGVTPFLRVKELARQNNIGLAPHFVMEQHLQLVATFENEGWVEHFDWLEPLFTERLEIRDGRMWLPDRPGFGLTPSETMRSNTRSNKRFGATIRDD